MHAGIEQRKRSERRREDEREGGRGEGASKR
jgi:hypothetical protein